MIFIDKNWPNDPRTGCKSPSNLVGFLEKDVDLEKELKSLKVNLKGMKLLKCKTSIIKILFSVEKLFVTMFVIFSLVRKIIDFRFFFLNLIF